jgi:hypothetical protein
MTTLYVHGFPYASSMSPFRDGMTKAAEPYRSAYGRVVPSRIIASTV